MCLIALVLSLVFTAQTSAATFTIGSSGDYDDANPGNGTCASAGGTGKVCTLRGALQEINALGGAHTIAFNIPTTDPGYNAARRVVVISILTNLPAIGGAGTIINGATQPNNNTGTLGVGGTVGVGNLTLPTVNRPDIEIVDGAGLAVGFDVSANNVTIRGLCMYGFGTTANANTSGNIRVNNVTGTLIEENVLGSQATSFTDPGAGARSVGDNIRIVNGDFGTIRNNLIGYSNGKGIGIEDDADNWTVTGNELRGNAIGNSNLDGLDVENGSGSITIRGNLTTENEGVGFDTYQSTGSNIIENNTITRNGRGTGGNVETSGVRLYGSGNLVDRNIINANYGAGILVTTASTGNRLTRNSIYDNGTITNSGGAAATGEIGIDLLSATDNENTGTSPYVTLNDSGDGDGNANGLLNYPIFTTAILSGGNLTLTGFARPNSSIELFIAAPDPRGFGEGRTYLVTLTEGAAADTDTGTGAYSGLVNGVNVGTDTTNRFRFIIAAPAGVVVTTVLTATATVGTSTSEFSGNIAVSLPPTLALAKCRQMGAQCLDTVTAALPGTDVAYVINFSNTAGASATNFVVTDQIPTNTDFKIGTSAVTLGTTGLTAATTYSNDGGTTWAYTPVSGGAGAPAGYDRAVTHVRWSFTGSLTSVSPNNKGSVAFVVRVR